ncbi:MAG: L,D-transpeptidase family protein [Campylobacterales bacterium]|nr:L,D-transpeptidase family protein [Campylobacterales bacterium]
MYKLILILLPLFLFSSIPEVDYIDDFNTKTSLKIKENLNKNHKLKQKRILKTYYKFNKYKTFWVDEYGVKKLSYDLMNSIKNDPVLKPKIDKLFNFKKIDKLIFEVLESTTSSNIVELDFELTLIYDRYMSFLANGLINWKDFSISLRKINEKEEISAIWEKYSIRKNNKKLLKKSIKHSNLKIAFTSVDITFPKAAEFGSYISFYEDLEEEGGFVKVKRFKYYPKIGSKSININILRERLKQEPFNLDLTCSEKNINIENCENIFDQNMKTALKLFQKNHGKVADGKAGYKTIRALNISAKYRLTLLRLNYERMRWIPRTLGTKHLIVNIPEYKLKLYDKNKLKLEIDVIVGKKIFPTPIFSNKISYIVLNPYWRIPQTIVKKEIIPNLVKNPFYLEPRGIRIHENWDHNSKLYDTSNIDWNDYLDNDLIGNSFSAPMRFIQIPSKNNPLGKIKFMFPNKYSIYLHDTPSKYLFKYPNRAFSHGCVRVKKPHELLKILASLDKNINYKKSREILKDIEKKDISLSKKIPVHFIYLTSWVNNKGKLQFRDDVYNYDKLQSRILYK